MSTEKYTIDHRLSDEEPNVHYDWSCDRDPRLTISSGDTVRFECRDATNGQLGPDGTIDDFHSMVFEGHPLTGPVAIENAEPGDVLEITLLELDHHGYGVTYFYEGDREKGLLPDKFEHPSLHVWELNGQTAHFTNDIQIPVEPFPGCIGVAPGEPGRHKTTPPYPTGGNLDIKHLTAGSTLYLPVETAGALFSIGDCHAAQGDGEVCVTGIEAPMSVTARFDVHTEISLDRPRFETTGPFIPTNSSKAHATTGIDSTLMGASKQAITAMIEHLHTERQLTREEAYLLCSVAVDLKINEVVNTPNYVVSAYLPEAIFPPHADP